MDESSAVAPPPQVAAVRAEPRTVRAADLLIAVILTIAGAASVWFLPAGTAVRIALVAPVLLFTPGYLLLQAVVLPGTHLSRPVHASLAVGTSVGVVGLLALSTAFLPGGFRPDTIVATVSAVSLAFAAIANYRRTAARRAPLAHAKPEPKPREEPAAVPKTEPMPPQPMPAPSMPVPAAAPPSPPAPPSLASP